MSFSCGRKIYTFFPSSVFFSLLEQSVDIKDAEFLLVRRTESSSWSRHPAGRSAFLEPWGPTVNNLVAQPAHSLQKDQ